jgi:hypothetical protein
MTTKIKIRKTLKLIDAVRWLSDNPRGDCSVEEFISGMERLKIKPEQVYREMRAWGYVWNGVYWIHKNPVWLKNLYRDIENRNQED